MILVTIHCLITSLARIVTAKSYSADVERLISIYNKLKSNSRESLSPGTVKKYLHISQNIGDLEAFHHSHAALDWLRAKTRRESLPEKAQQQEWLLGVHKETSIFKDQQKPNQIKKIRAMKSFERSIVFTLNIIARRGIIFP